MADLPICLIIWLPRPFYFRRNSIANHEMAAHESDAGKLDERRFRTGCTTLKIWLEIIERRSLFDPAFSTHTKPSLRSGCGGDTRPSQIVYLDPLSSCRKFAKPSKVARQPIFRDAAHHGGHHAARLCQGTFNYQQHCQESIIWQPNR